MKRGRLQRIFILNLSDGAVKITLKSLVLALILYLACTAGAAKALEYVARWAGGSEGLLNSAFMLELGTSPDGEGIISTMLSVVAPKFSAPSPTVSPSQVPEATATPKVTPTPKITPEPTAGLSHESVEISGETEGIDVAAIFYAPFKIKLGGAPQILIIHTHSTESYAASEGDTYVETDVSRTLNKKYNVVRIGDELAAALEKKGFSVIHDRGIYDYPSYAGSYSRSLSAIEAYLKAYPSIQIVIDVHRDALMDTEGNIYKTSAVINGKETAQVMLVVGTGEAGLNNPNWQENLKLAFHLQAAMNTKYEGLARPICITTERYNGHVTAGSLLVEIGCSGNTLGEALEAARLFADSASYVLEGLI